MQTFRRMIQFAVISGFLLSASVLPAAPWAVVVDHQWNRIGMLDFGTTSSPTAYGPFLEGQLGTTNTDGLCDVAITPDGRQALISHFWDQAIYRVDISNPTNPVVTGCISNVSYPEDIAIAPNGRFAIVTDGHGAASTNMAIIDLSSFSTSITYSITSGAAQAVAIAPDNQTVILCDCYSNKVIYGLLGSTGLVSESVLSVGENTPINVAIAPDGKTVLIANSNTNDINVFRILNPGNVVTAETPIVVGLTTGLVSQSIAFSPAGDRAYVLQKGNLTNMLSWLKINSPGNVTLGGAGVARLLSRASEGSYAGVDTLAVSPDGVWALAGNPTGNTITNVLSLVNLSTYAVSSLDASLGWPVGVAFALPPSFNTQVTTSPTSPVPAVGETVTCLITVTNIGYQTLNPVQINFGFNTNYLTYTNGAPSPDTAVGGALTWTNVGPLAMSGTTVVTARFTAARSTLPGTTTNTVVSTAYTAGGYLLAPQTNSVAVTIMNSFLGADFDGDRLADPAMYDASSGTWKVKLSTAGYVLFTFTGLLGEPTYAAAAADYDGDRLADPAVYQESSGIWIILKSSLNYAEWVFPHILGAIGYSGMPADYDGDRLADPCVYNRNTGDWNVMLSSAGYYLIAKPSFLGGSGYKAIPADYDGDRKADPAIYGESNGLWVIMLSSVGYLTVAMATPFGGSGYIPVPADYDGDGLADPAVKSETSNEWLVMLSSANYAIIPVTLIFE